MSLTVGCMDVTRTPDLNTTQLSGAVPYSLPLGLPAWVPAVTVASAMLIFLTASFYIRHRKVVKKRTILMDYLHIIFQYGGMRRKRMVAALCNTNAITLRELGRSFMISFDSVGPSGENTCPFYMEDTAFTNAVGPPMTSAMQKKFPKSRGKKLRATFRRLGTNSGDNFSDPAGPSSFHDIVMKFKVGGRHPPSAPASVFSTPSQPRRDHRRSSMCTIHGDELDYHDYMGSNYTLYPHNPQQQNGYSLRINDAPPRYINADSSSLFPYHTTPEQALDEKKKYSDPSDQTGVQGERSPRTRRQEVYHVRDGQGVYSSMMLGSHGYTRSLKDVDRARRHKEPTILIHGTSTDSDSASSWNDVETSRPNGILLLKRCSHSDGSTSDYYFEQQMTPPPDPARRASLSTVSYVPSGNMNEYYHSCRSDTARQPQSQSSKETPAIIQTANVDNKARFQPRGRSRFSKNVPKGSSLAGGLTGPTISKKSRLSLGEIGATNFDFNRRIVAFPSDSIPEYDPNSFGDNKPPQSKPAMAWTRFKNVFSGSRGSQNSNSQGKAPRTSYSHSEDRSKRRGRRHPKRWNRFINVLTGFRSLPDSKLSRSVNNRNESKSVPSDLNTTTSSFSEIYCSSRCNTTRKWHSSKTLGKDYTFSGKYNSGHEGQERSNSYKAPAKPQSFPEFLSTRQHVQPFSRVLQVPRSTHNGRLIRPRSALRWYAGPYFPANNSKSIPRSKSDNLQFYTDRSVSSTSPYRRYAGHSSRSNFASIPRSKSDNLQPYGFAMNVTPLPPHEAHMVVHEPQKIERNRSTADSSDPPLLYQLSHVIEKCMNISPHRSNGGNVNSNEKSHMCAPSKRFSLPVHETENSHNQESMKRFSLPLYTSEVSTRPTNSRHKPQTLSFSLRDPFNSRYKIPLPSNTSSGTQTSNEYFRARQNLEPNYYTDFVKGTQLCERVPSQTYLNVERRQMDVSSESIYFDTFSALDMPSPNESPRRADVTNVNVEQRYTNFKPATEPRMTSPPNTISGVELACDKTELPCPVDIITEENELKGGRGEVGVQIIPQSSSADSISVSVDNSFLHTPDTNSVPVDVNCFPALPPAEAEVTCASYPAEKYVPAAIGPSEVTAPSLHSCENELVVDKPGPLISHEHSGMANLTRLPRFPRRASQGAVFLSAEQKSMLQNQFRQGNENLRDTGVIMSPAASDEHSGRPKASRQTLRWDYNTIV